MFQTILLALILALNPMTPEKGGKQAPPGRKACCVLCDKCECDPCKCELTGIWHATFHDDGKCAYGVCLIHQVGERYVFNWATGSSNTVGVGIRKGKHIAVSWMMNGKVQGVSLYEVKGKTLHGIWSPIPTDQAERTEVLRYLRPIADKEI